MSWRRTFFLFLIFSLLVSFYYYKIGRFSLPPKSNFWSHDASSRQSLILPLNSDEQVIRLSFDLSDAGRVVLERKDDTDWRILSPVKGPAEAMVAEGLLNVLKLMPRVRELPFKSRSVKEYGFDRPSQRICVASNQRESCLYIGAEGAISKGRYGKWEDEHKFFLTSSELPLAFDRTLYSLRQKQVISFGKKEIDSLQLRSSERELLILREGSHWVLKKPDSSIVGSSAVEELSLKLTHLYAKDFIDDADEKDPRFGLGASLCVIRVSFSDGSKQTLIRGREAPGLDAYYVENQERNSVFLVSMGKFNELEQAFKAVHPF